MIKMIISDLDGTLLPPGYGKISERLFTQIPALRRMGIDFCLATGRQYPGCFKMFRDLAPELYYITNNGGDVHYKGETLRLIEIPTSRLDELISEIESIPGLLLEAAGASSGYTATDNQAFFDMLVHQVGYVEKNIESLHNPPEPLLKLAVNHYGYPTFDKDLAEHFREKYGDTYDVVYSGNGWLDFMTKGIGKGSAVKFLMEKMGLKRDEVIIFGDNENDLSMFEEVDCCYAMAHSFDHVKAKATRVTEDVTNELERIISGDFQ